MLRIEGFVNDKDASRVIHALAGICYDFKILPVPNARVGKGGKLEAKTNGDVVSQLEQWLKEKHIASSALITPTMLKDFAQQTGRSIKSYSNILRTLMSSNYLKKVPKAKAPGKGNFYARAGAK